VSTSPSLQTSDFLFVRGSFGTPGGIGHALIDLYTPMILAQLLGIRFVYAGIQTIAIGRYDTNIRGLPEHELTFPWEDLFGLREELPSEDEAATATVVPLSGHGQWSLFNSDDLAQMRHTVERYRAEGRPVLFQISNNERVWYWQLVYWEAAGLVPAGSTQRFRETIRRPFRRALGARGAARSAGQGPRIAVHIRNSGLWPDDFEHCQRQRHGMARVAEWLDAPIDVYSEGQDADLARIRELYEGVPARMHFNTGTEDSFVALATADVVSGGKSSFFMQAGLLSPALKLSWYDYDVALQEMVTCKREPMMVDEEWLIVRDDLDHGTFTQHYGKHPR
jgi:hypothetical protein